MYGIFTHKELLCFYKPLRIITSDFLERQNIIDQSSVKKVAETLGFFTLSSVQGFLRVSNLVWKNELTPPPNAMLSLLVLSIH